jgi:hypothetical protein
VTNLLKMLTGAALGLCLVLGSTQTFAASQKTEDGKIQEEMNKFCVENAKLREEHIQSLREAHLKHINEYYDKKLELNKEISELWKTLKPGDKTSKQVILEQIKIKQEAFNKAEDKDREDFKENILKKKNKEFRDSMDERFKKLKIQHQE